MKLKIGMSFELDVNSEKSFLNELILETKKAFQQEATGKFLGFILENVDQQMCDQLVRMGSAVANQDPELKLLAKPPKTIVTSCCAHPKYSDTAGSRVMSRLDSHF